MKSSVLFYLFLLVWSVSTAQSDYKATHDGWLVKVDEAYALSQKTGRPILANFTGSDWCGWCKRLSKAVFDKPGFKTWAADKVVLLELDFPARTKQPDEIREQNQALQQAFRVQGYPTVWVFRLNKDPNTGGFLIEGLGRTGYTETLEQFTTDVDQMIKRGKAGG